MRKGFSLVELSIVLVILGLLTGGIVAGQSLIKSAELKTVTTESEKYITGAKMFRQKYDSLPGDFPNATVTWGPAHATPASCVTTPSTGKETCDGNDDGYIYPSAGSNESYRFWQHLANAGYIEGSFDGVTHGAQPYSSTDANSPRSSFTSGGWFVWDWPSAYSGNAGFFDSSALYYSNTLALGKGWNVDSWPGTALLTPEQAWNLDTKTDDGKPSTGKLVIYRYNPCTDATNSADVTADYALDLTTAGCVMLWRNAFQKM